jgi:hypothetical protein
VYDGIKIDCQVTDPRKWNTSLNSIGRYDQESGEVLPFAEAKACGLSFLKNQTPQGTRYTIQGSLHRFARNGGENNDDFNIVEVANTIETLKNKFGINPDKSKILNFEFGVNIQLPEGITAAEFQKYLVSAYTRGFEKLNRQRAAVGYIAEFEEFSIKIYDKGYQSGSGESQQLRIEIKVIRTRWLEQFGIIRRGEPLYLSRLLDKTIITQLGDILKLKLSSLICTPRNIDESRLTPKEKMTFRECRDARSWEEWDSKTRERKHAQLQRIFLKVGQADPVDVLQRLVAEKWKALSHFRLPVPTPEKPKKVALSTVIVVGIRSLIEMIITGHMSIIRAMLTKGEISGNTSMLIYAPRGNPLCISHPEHLLTGFKRWIDLRIRAPTKAVSVTTDCLIDKQNE